jgi:hypothetical protein
MDNTVRDTDVSENPIASNFYPEDGGNIFLHTAIYNNALKYILSPSIT